MNPDVSTTRSPTVPIVLLVDVEPDGFFVDHDTRALWSGFERGLEIMAELRHQLAEATGRPARFTWLVRADNQIAEVYGSPAWALQHYRRRLEALIAADDEVGLHVHAYRWEPRGAGGWSRGNRWIEDYGNQPWVDHCVRMGIECFEATLRRKPASFSMGMDWTNQATIELVTELQVRYEFSAVPGMTSRPLRDLYLLGAYTGVTPESSQLPRHPYHPSPRDFALPAVDCTDGIWIFPQSSRIAPPDFSWKRRLYNRLRGTPFPPGARKFFLTDDPAGMRDAIDAVLRRRPPRYLTFAIRTDEFRKRRPMAAMRRNLEYVLGHPAAQALAFATPAEVLQLLGCSAAAPRQVSARS